jgi:cytochrome c
MMRAVMGVAAVVAATGVALTGVVLTSVVLADSDAERGARRFEECVACHALEKDKESVGPSLYGVFGRKAGAGADFRYSPALKRSGITWDQASIDTFIADPQAAVPGNRMPYAGIADAAARADLVAYLVKTFK